jgi:WD40 repeat protein
MNDFNYSYFLATGRDGTYSIFALDRAAANTAVRPVHQGTPPLGPMIEAAWFSGSDLILYGFKSKNFIVWNETKQYEISSVECGGAHRSYDYSPRQGSDGAGYFIYTKASKLYLHTQSKPSHQIIKPGGHGREIKACAVSGEGLIATGAEDTTIRIWSYGKQFDCLAVVQKHTTGIQHLQWHGSYLFSSGGNEEFFIWAVEPIPGFGIGVVCEAACPDQSEEKDLRIMSFDVGEWNRSNTANDSKLLISIAYSDSTIRIYTYSKGDGFHLVVKGRYTSSCLMQLRHLEVHRQELFLLTAATDGNLTVWRTGMQANHSNEASDSALTLLTSHRVHQSSIKSLDITRNHSQIVVATGGDDNALAISVYENLDKVPRSVRLCSAHAAAITGLSFVSNSSTTDEEAQLRIATSGNDQRVREWRVRLGTRIPDITKIEDVFTSVADVGDLTSMNSWEEREPKRVLIVGNGMEVYKASMARS